VRTDAGDVKKRSRQHGVTISPRRARLRGDGSILLPIGAKGISKI